MLTEKYIQLIGNMAANRLMRRYSHLDIKFFAGKRGDMMRMYMVQRDDKRQLTGRLYDVEPIPACKRAGSRSWRTGSKPRCSKASSSSSAPRSRHRPALPMLPPRRTSSPRRTTPNPRQAPGRTRLSRGTKSASDSAAVFTLC